MVAPPPKEVMKMILVKMTADYWTGKQMLSEGGLYNVPQDLALQVEKEGLGKIMNREALESTPKPRMMNYKDYKEYTVPELDDILRERDLPLTGLKDDKIKRLIESDE